MGNIIVSEYVSLDGVMEDPAWTGPYWNDEIAKFKFDELFASDALQRRILKGQDHAVAPEALAPVLMEFFKIPQRGNAYV